METRGRYVLIGLFAVAGFLGVMGFFLAFGKLQFDRQFAYYEVRFESVSGLSRSADVRFAGLPVGQVVDIRLSPDQDGTALVRLEVDRDTPVRADSVATVDSSGITGVAFVALSPGSGELINDRTDVPELEAGRSTIQSLTEGAPRILDETLRVLEQVNEILGEQNQQRVVAILDNVEQSTGEITRALDIFAAFTDTISESMEVFTEFGDNLSPILLQAESAIETLQFAIEEAGLVATQGRIALEAGTETLETIDTFVAIDLAAMVTEFRDTTTLLRDEFEGFSGQARTLVEELSAMGIAATDRLALLDPALARVEPLLERAESALAEVEQTSASIGALVTGEGTQLVTDARILVQEATIATRAVATVAETDLPLIIADVRAATGDIRTMVDVVGEDLQGFSGRLDALGDSGVRTLDQVTETFANANATLAAINRALATSEGAIEAAERAFIGADRVMNEEIAAITADLRDVLARLGNAVDAVSEDIPAVTADLRRTADSAARAFDDIGRLVRDSSGPVREFTTSGLPNLALLAREARGLVTNLDRLTRQLERDPTRFLLNRQTPEFRR